MMAYFQHRIKCLNCGLHFIVCSDYENWPDVGTTRDLQHSEATGLIYCPECGSHSRMLHYRIEVDEFIFQIVPGQAELVELR